MYELPHVPLGVIARCMVRATVRYRGIEIVEHDEVGRLTYMPNGSLDDDILSLDVYYNLVVLHYRGSRGRSCARSPKGVLG